MTWRRCRREGMPLRPLKPRVAHHGQPSRAVLGSWETTPAPKVREECIREGQISQATFLTGGIVHVPSRIDGSLSCGQYIRNIRMNLPAGAGSQLLSLSDPGLSFWMYSSMEPSGFAFRFCRGLIEK